MLDKQGRCRFSLLLLALVAITFAVLTLVRYSVASGHESLSSLQSAQVETPTGKADNSRP
jgi:hypothetical protein